MSLKNEPSVRDLKVNTPAGNPFNAVNTAKSFFPEIGTKGQIVLPKIGLIKAILHRRFSGTVKTFTVVRDPSDKYYASVLVDDAQAPIIPDAIDFEHTAGIDAGIKTALTVVGQSGTVKIENPTF